MSKMTLHAGQGLILHLSEDPHWRIEWGEPDWLGPIRLCFWKANETALKAVESSGAFQGADDLGEHRRVEVVRTNPPRAVSATVRVYRDAPVLVFRLEARSRLSNLSTGRFSRPSVSWPTFFPAARTEGGVAADTRSYGHQYSEFALPVFGDSNASGFFFAPHRPPVVIPLLFTAPDGRTLVLAPLDSFHEQIIAVPADAETASDGVRCGWHGDLAEVPEGFATEFAVWAADTPRRALEEWAQYLRRRHRTQRPSRYADDGVGKLSYWTDNGAVYYYRTEPGLDYAGTLERVVVGLHESEVPIRSVQIDSWFYPHENLRPISSEGAPIVPPSGMMKWEPREDAFPGGLRKIRQRLRGLPLIFHSRHFSRSSPYFERYAAWLDESHAHPADSSLLERLIAQAAAWGAITYEQDWMVESFLGVRGLREVPGRGREWQEALDRAAAEQGLTLQWCMATPADFLQTLTLRRVTSIRTSGDYRYLFDNGFNWTWFLHTNAFARALGLNPFKDVFLSHGETELSAGESYAEVEALLAALSAGPVGIGDQIGKTNRDIVMRTCREDGILIKPDVPIAAIDACFRTNSFLARAPLIGEAFSAHPAGRWIYVASCNVCRERIQLDARVNLADLGDVRPTGPVVAYDWRRRTWERLQPNEGWNLSLPFQDWDYRVICPLLPGGMTVFGDVGKYATVGDRRIANIAHGEGQLRFDVLGASETIVEVQGYGQDPPRRVTSWQPGEAREVVPGPEGWSWDPATRLWIVRVRIGLSGRLRVALEWA
jgi:hypothetical protein